VATTFGAGTGTGLYLYAIAHAGVYASPTCRCRPLRCSTGTRATFGGTPTLPKPARVDILLMPVVESVAHQGLRVVASFLPRLTSSLEARMIADHRPIAGTNNLGQGGRHFWLWVAVAPSRSPNRLDPQEFTEQAHELARLVFGEDRFRIDYLGSEEGRFIESDRDAASEWGDAHTLRVHPDGRVVMQWVLSTKPIAGVEGAQLSLDEIIEFVNRTYCMAHDLRFRAIHGRRRTGKFRRLDWRVGLSPSISGPDGSIYWRSLSSSTGIPDVLPTGQRPSCPTVGFASDKMVSLKQSATLSETFRPALEQLLVDAGYTGGVRACVDKALSASASSSGAAGLSATCASSASSPDN
jgi:hypothetical protein